MSNKADKLKKDLGTLLLVNYITFHNTGDMSIGEHIELFSKLDLLKYEFRLLTGLSEEEIYDKFVSINCSCFDVRDYFATTGKFPDKEVSISINKLGINTVLKNFGIKIY
jgi:hypothetical protein